MTEQKAEALAQALNQRIGVSAPSGLTLTGWRFDLHEVNQLEIGLKNSKMGGPYSSPSMKEDVGGEVFLLWEGGRYTSGKIDRRVLEEFDDNWELWQRTAFTDLEGPDLVAPFTPPEIPLCDEAVRGVVLGEDQFAFDLLTGRLRVQKETYGAQKVDGRFKASLDRRFIRNSRGVDIRYEQTPVSYFIEVDDLFGDAFAEKRLPYEEEIQRIDAYIGEVYSQLRQEIPLPMEGKIPILLPPKVHESFLDHYLISNLQGSLVANHQSAFDYLEFTEHRSVFRTDLTVRIDGTRPYRGGSYRCTAEGIPTGKVDLIKEGRLQTPILGLKYAKRLGMKPTPVPAGDGVLLETHSPLDYDRFIAEAERCLIVHSLLGLHTQDYSTGNFSLTADQCLWVEKGKILGKVKAVISGNYFEALRSDETVFARTPWDDNPACSFLATISR